MTLAQIVLLGVKLSIILIVFALGLKSNFADLTSLFRRPWLLVRSLFSMSVVMPLFAVTAISLFPLHRAVALALVALSLAPVPPLLLKKQAKAGGEASYTVALFATAAAFAILWVPLAIELIERVFGVPMTVTAAAVAKIALVMVLIPLVAGITVRALSAGFADRIQPFVSAGGAILLIVGALGMLFGTWRTILDQIGNGTVLIFVAFALFGLAVGHLLGGPDPSERTVLALATSSRHPGMAIAISHITFPDEGAAVAAIALYLIISGLVSLPYVKWRTRAETAAPPYRKKPAA